MVHFVYQSITQMVICQITIRFTLFFLNRSLYIMRRLTFQRNTHLSDLSQLTKREGLLIVARIARQGFAFLYYYFIYFYEAENQR